MPGPSTHHLRAKCSWLALHTYQCLQAVFLLLPASHLPSDPSLRKRLGSVIEAHDIDIADILPLLL